MKLPIIQYNQREVCNDLFILQGNELFEGLTDGYICDFICGIYDIDGFKEKFKQCAKYDYSINQDDNQNKLDKLIGQLATIAGLTFYFNEDLSKNIYSTIDVLKDACGDLNEEFLTWKVDGLLNDLGIKKQL